MNFGRCLASSRIFPTYSPSTDVARSCSPPKNNKSTMMVVIPWGMFGRTSRVDDLEDEAGESQNGQEPPA